MGKWYGYTHPYHEQRTSLMQDYFLLMLLTGLRRQEAASLCWQNIDLKDRTLTIEHTKNRQLHVLPLSDYLYALILRRQPFSQQHHSDYLFPAESETGHLKDPRKAMLKIAELSGIPFTIHDLRRTFITLAELVLTLRPGPI
ncbi:MAG: tyrosine-type recombinase/integrase [Gammaproteobacteria bacterium]|nr:tyrosine-type recombinase/integrase [Gammaproteobacteria bacterium]